MLNKYLGCTLAVAHYTTVALVMEILGAEEVVLSMADRAALEAREDALTRF